MPIITTHYHHTLTHSFHASINRCPDKQINDNIARRTGKPIPTQVPTAVFGDSYEPYQDKTKSRIVRLQKERNSENVKNDEKWRTQQYAQAAQSIPNVHYNPMTALQKMQSGECYQLFLQAADSGRPDVYLTKRQSDPRHEAEREFVTALQAARSGDQRALFDYYMSKGAPAPPNNNSSSSSDIIPSHGGVLEEWSYRSNGEGGLEWFDGSINGSDEPLLAPPSFPVDSEYINNNVYSNNVYNDNNNNEYNNNNNNNNNNNDSRVLRSS